MQHSIHAPWKRRGEEDRREKTKLFLFGEFIHLALHIFVWEKGKENRPTMKTLSHKKKGLLRFWASSPKHYTVYGWPRRTVIRLALELDGMMWNENIGLVLLMTTSMSKLFFLVTKARTSLSILYKSERDSLILHSSKSEEEEEEEEEDLIRRAGGPRLPWHWPNHLMWINSHVMMAKARKEGGSGSSFLREKKRILDRRKLLLACLSWLWVPHRTNGRISPSFGMEPKAKWAMSKSLFYNCN